MATTFQTDPNPSSDAAELQEVLTRYVDSRDGYRQASALVEETGLASALAAIADRREEIAARVASMIYHEGEKADFKGSPEASVHRWWIRLKDKLTKHESDTILSECLRGEKELARTLTDAIEDGHLEPDHAAVIQEALVEIDLAIRSFETALGEEPSN